jgi:hypothetical protein
MLAPAMGSWQKPRFPVRALFWFALVAGCSGDRANVSPRVARCRDVCEATKSCPQADTYQRSVDCYTICDDVDAVNSSAQCYPSFDRLYDCVERVGVCADIAALCRSQEEVYGDCIADNCSSDPDRDDCSL